MAGSIRRDLHRMARMRAEGSSFGAALALGMGLGQAASRSGSATRYNGKGLEGDQEAIAEDFHAAIKKRSEISNRRG